MIMSGTDLGSYTETTATDILGATHYSKTGTYSSGVRNLTRATKNTAIHTKPKTAKDLYHEISLMFILLRMWTKREYFAQERTDLVSKLEKWMRHIISRYQKSPNELMKKCSNTFANVLKQFTFVMYLFVSSPTNLIEQSIRKVIGHRNNLIQLKSDIGADKLCTLLICVDLKDAQVKCLGGVGQAYMQLAPSVIDINIYI